MIAELLSDLACFPFSGTTVVSSAIVVVALSVSPDDDWVVLDDWTPGCKKDEEGREREI